MVSPDRTEATRNLTPRAAMIDPESPLPETGAQPPAGLADYPGIELQILC
jgi:hypothetical protein